MYLWSTHFRQIVPTVIGLAVLLMIIPGAGCGSADKYQKTEDETPAESVEGELSVRIPQETQDWFQEMTQRMAAAQLAYNLGDTARAIHAADSLMQIAEGIIDTLAFEDPLQRFLFLYVTEGFNKVMLWQRDPEARAALTRRHEKLAMHLQQRRDSLVSAGAKPDSSI
jgi:hypothetical protein